MVWIVGIICLFVGLLTGLLIGFWAGCGYYKAYRADLKNHKESMLAAIKAARGIG